MKEKNQGEKCLEDEDLDEISGGKTVNENKTTGDGNLVGGSTTDFYKMLAAIDMLDQSGQLNHLK